MASAEVRALINSFDPVKELAAGDVRYVDCSQARNTPALLEWFENAIDGSDGNLCLLLSGIKGCGKSTELNQLCARFDRKTSTHLVVHCHTEEFFYTSDVQFTDIVLALVHQLWRACRDVGLRLESSKLRGLIDELGEVMVSPVNLKDLEIDAGLAKVGIEIQRNALNRQVIHSHLRPRASSLIDVVNDLFERAKTMLESSHPGRYRGILVVLDGLEKIQPFTSADAVNTHELIFIHNGEQFRALECDLLLTVPPQLVHSGPGAQLQTIYGVAPRILPAIPVSNQSGANSPDGHLALERIVRRRVEAAGLNMQDAFDEQAWKLLIYSSGGFVRNLITMFRNALFFCRSLPLTLHQAQLAARETMNNLLLSIGDDEDIWQRLKHVESRKTIATSRVDLMMLDAGLVFEYLADVPWFDVNPLLRASIPRFAP